uniref:UMOD/GP2/OIT3-like D8C domain-containing protein n=1 Tax=Hippocampus comes TaxID=109280 RepID=A0A3Q2Y304_HIPCM
PWRFLINVLCALRFPAWTSANEFLLLPCQGLRLLRLPEVILENPQGNIFMSQWRGWYRLFLGGNNARIPERCIDENMCGTHAPLWIRGPHPTQSNMIASRTVCNAWSRGCCHFASHNIHVKLCSTAASSYYVYKLVKPSTCHLAYCAGISPFETFYTQT